jgi:hypothetical protein
VTAPTALPYGIRDLKLTLYTDASGSVLDSASVDLPNMQTLTFSEKEEFQELRGDDRIVAIHGSGASIDWSLEAGGISFDALEILGGGVVTLSGLTPNRVWTLRKMGSGIRPYFRVEGQIISDSGGDLHAVIYRCRCNDTIEGTFADGEFYITAASGQGLPLLTSGFDLLYDIVQNETTTPIPSVPVANPVS